MDDTSKTQADQGRTQAEDDLTVEYANNVYFAPNVWDLKILFGELSGVKRAVDWHTAITLPWAQAKLMAYYLAVNIAVFEGDNGPIKVPESMLPDELPPAPDSVKNNPAHAAVIAFVKEQREKLIKSQK